MDQYLFELNTKLLAEDIFALQDLLKGTELEYVANEFLVQMNEQINGSPQE